MTLSLRQNLTQKTGSPELYVLDVGHGNCTIVRQAAEVLIIDAALGNVHVQMLRMLGITRVSRVLLSHLDVDHMGGLSTLLLDEDTVVGEVRFNPDASKRTISFQSMRRALADARHRNATAVRTHLSSALGKELSFGDVEIEVLLPDPLDVASGPSGLGMDGGPLDSNTLSAVIRVRLGSLSVLLPGDLDHAGLERLSGLSSIDLHADVLIFPHHGGRPRSSRLREFARELCRLVSPSHVLFSLGREKLRNPHPLIIQGTFDAVPEARIVCTQLSKRCAAELPDPPEEDHLAPYPAAGLSKHRCCAGTVGFTGDPGVLSIAPSAAAHGAFINNHAPSALCRELRPVSRKGP